MSYRYYGFRASFYFHPRLLPAHDSPQAPLDVEITQGEVPERLPNLVWAGPFLSVAADGDALVDIAPVGRFLIRGGRSITVGPASDAPLSDIEASLIGPVAAPLLYQRGLLPLHASCVQWGPYAVAISGRRGAGKSTLAAGFVRRGAALLTDDVCPVRLSDSGAIETVAGCSAVRLWPDSQAVFGDRVSHWRQVRRDYAKRAGLLLAPPPPSGWRPLSAILRIRASDVYAPEVRPLRGPAALAPLNETLHRYAAGIAIGGAAELFRRITGVAASVPIFELRRPVRECGVETVEEVVETTIRALSELP